MSKRLYYPLHDMADIQDEEYLWRDIEDGALAQKKLKRSYWFPPCLWELIKLFFVDDGVGALKQSILRQIDGMRIDTFSAVFEFDPAFRVWSRGGNIWYVYEIDWEKDSPRTKSRDLYWNHQYCYSRYHCMDSVGINMNWFGSLYIPSRIQSYHDMKILQYRLTRRMHAEWQRLHRPGTWIAWRSMQ